MKIDFVSARGGTRHNVLLTGEPSVGHGRGDAVASMEGQKHRWETERKVIGSKCLKPLLMIKGWRDGMSLGCEKHART